MGQGSGGVCDPIPDFTLLQPAVAEDCNISIAIRWNEGIVGQETKVAAHPLRMFIGNCIRSLQVQATRNALSMNHGPLFRLPAARPVITARVTASRDKPAQTSRREWV